MTLEEEYYTVPIFDLIGLVGGTLGMFTGFSFYGTISDILSLTVSLILKTRKLSFEEYLTFTLIDCLVTHRNEFDTTLKMSQEGHERH